MNEISLRIFKEFPFEFGLNLGFRIYFIPRNSTSKTRERDRFFSSLDSTRDVTRADCTLDERRAVS